MFFPDYFADRAKKCLELAKRIRDPKLAVMFAERARILKKTAMEAERSMALLNSMAKPNPPVVISQAKTLADLRRELLDLPDGMSLCIPIRDYSPDLRHELWRASPDLSYEFGCTGEFRPDGHLWFVKRSLRP